MINKEFIEKIENKINHINILDSDPFVKENCKNLYRALLVVMENENINDINSVLNDINKTIELLKKFDSINKEKYNGSLSYIVIDIKNNQTLLYLIELLKKSLNQNNESNETKIQEKDTIDNNKKININVINDILNFIFDKDNVLNIDNIENIKFLPSKKGFTVELSNNNKKLYLGISEYGSVEIVRENSIDGKIIYMPMDD